MLLRRHGLMHGCIRGVERDNERMASVLDWLQQLRAPACYVHRPAHVDIVQTHVSVVCLAGDQVFKLKKAVALPFLDFSTLARRRFFCDEELRLNRRLCPQVYLDVVPLLATAGGVRFGRSDEDGDVVDWAVRMTRLPAERMLDRMLAEHRVDRAAIEELARTVAAFHAGAERGADVLAAGAPERLAGFAHANFTELQTASGHGLSARLLAALAAVNDRDFAQLSPLLRARAAAGRVVDGHGDLHARNICMTAPVTVYDCLEFSAALRCGDVATENAFLVMDLRYRGAPALADAYVRAYVDASGDGEQPALLPPLVRYRAMVRAKVAALAAAEIELPAADRDAARASAAAHVHLAAASAIETRAPRWLAVCGPPASGKSALAAALAPCGPWPVLATDVVRKELAGVPLTGRARPEHYTAAFSDRTYGDVLARATASLAPVVILDGNFPDPARRAQTAAAARARGAALHWIHLAVDDATAGRRLAARASDATAVSDAGAAEAAMLRARFVPPTVAEGAVTTLDGGRDLVELVDAALAALVQPAP
jgi:hypothetical protein